MEITIHYKGKAKGLEAIDGLIEKLKQIAITFSWNYGIIDEEVKGKVDRKGRISLSTMNRGPIAGNTAMAKLRCRHLKKRCISQKKRCSESIYRQ